MKVSVIMPVFNTEKYVKNSIYSVLSQTYDDFELIIIDDGSTDCSYRLCSQIKDPRIKLIRQSNKGLPIARNAGVEASKGEYIAFLDSDDVWVPQKLERHVSHLEASPEVGISFCYSAFINESGAPTGLFQIQPCRGISPKRLFISNLVGNGSSAVVRKAVFFSLVKADPSTCPGRPFDEELHHAEDYELWNRIALLTPWKIEGIPEVLTLYRLRESSLSCNTEVHEKFHELALQKIRRYSPRLVHVCGHTAKAHFQWYLARIAVQKDDGKQAICHMLRALAYDPLAWQFYYPLIFGAALCSLFLPKAIYRSLEKTAMALYGKYQRQKMSQVLKKG
jgi:glycosyltransferase involved in cell wall biosynthesis